MESLNRKDIDWGVKALNRMAGGFIAQPYNDDYFPLEDGTIEDILATPLDFLSDADKKLYRRIVSKR